jgi:putative FmdB family regulatory protein
MPTYEYVCDACGHQFDEFQSIKDEPLKKCPECKKPKLRRLIGAGAALLFKGSGFYITDYRSEAYKSAAKRESEAAGSTKSENSTSAANGSNGAGGKDSSSAARGKSKSSSE